MIFLRCVAVVPAVELIRLLKGPGTEQLAGISSRHRLIDLSGQTAGFADTAAAISCADLVVSCDRAPAHLSGALNIPTWTALSYAPDRRWGTTGASTDWYPSMELFRQGRDGRWEPVFAEIARRLAAHVAARPN
jgi:hypothetical protein